MPQNRNRLPRREGDLAYVPLTQGYEAVVDADDLHKVIGWRWCARRKPRNVYAVRSDYSGDRMQTLQMHSHILPNRPGFVIDHINGDSLDNRRCNLRYATHGQNVANSPVQQRSSTGLKGVRQVRPGRWIACITADKKHHYLGTFSCPQEAHEAYCAAALELHGPFARFK